MCTTTLDGNARTVWGSHLYPNGPYIFVQSRLVLDCKLGVGIDTSARDLSIYLVY